MVSVSTTNAAEVSAFKKGIFVLQRLGDGWALKLGLRQLRLGHVWIMLGDKVAKVDWLDGARLDGAMSFTFVTPQKTIHEDRWSRTWWW